MVITSHHSHPLAHLEYLPQPKHSASSTDSSQVTLG